MKIQRMLLQHIKHQTMRLLFAACPILYRGSIVAAAAAAIYYIAGGVLAVVAHGPTFTLRLQDNVDCGSMLYRACGGASSLHLRSHVISYSRQMYVYVCMCIHDVYYFVYDVCCVVWGVGFGRSFISSYNIFEWPGLVIGVFITTRDRKRTTAYCRGEETGGTTCVLCCSCSYAV